MVYDMFIYVQLSQEAKMIPKTTHFSRYVEALNKTQIFTGYFKYLKASFYKF